MVAENVLFLFERFCSFFSRQYLARAQVARDSHSTLFRSTSISTAAKYLEALTAGFPIGRSNLAAINKGISVSRNPKKRRSFAGAETPWKATAIQQGNNFLESLSVLVANMRE